MIVVRLKGGLGNQMFQIALGKKLEYLGKKVLFDINQIESRIDEHNITKSYEVFDIDLDVASSKDINSLIDLGTNLHDKIRRKIFGRKKTHYIETNFGDEDKKVYGFNDAYLDGYWQSYKYFSDCSSKVMDLFKFKPLTDDKNKYYEDKIFSCENPVSIHFRLGDYCTKENVKYFGNICTEEYYSKCINFLQNKYNNITFFVFSNDMKYAERFLDKKNYCVVDCNDEKNAWKDMYLMSICKSNIVANSSFSWWGAWLNKNNNKFVLAPKKWINGRDMKNICPDGWVRF